MISAAIRHLPFIPIRIKNEWEIDRREVEGEQAMTKTANCAIAAAFIAGFFAADLLLAPRPGITVYRQWIGGLISSGSLYIICQIFFKARSLFIDIQIEKTKNVLSARAIARHQEILQESALYTAPPMVTESLLCLFSDFRQFKDSFLNMNHLYSQEEIAAYFMNQLLLSDVWPLMPEEEVVGIFEFLLLKNPAIDSHHLFVIVCLLDQEASEKLLELLFKHRVPLPVLTEDEIVTLFCFCRSEKVVKSLCDWGIQIHDGGQVFLELCKNAMNLSDGNLYRFLELYRDYERLKVINSLSLPWKFVAISLSPINAIPKWLAYVKKIQALILSNHINKQAEYKFFIDHLPIYSKGSKKFLALPPLNKSTINRCIYHFLNSYSSRNKNVFRDVIIKIRSGEAFIRDSEIDVNRIKWWIKMGGDFAEIPKGDEEMPNEADMTENFRYLLRDRIKTEINSLLEAQHNRNAINKNKSAAKVYYRT